MKKIAPSRSPAPPNATVITQGTVPSRSEHHPHEFDGRFLGVLGGMGPLAGATFLARLTLLTPAHVDQDHIPTILWSDPRVPGRPAAWLQKGDDPFPWMLNGIRHLEAAGAQAIVIPCNTAHLWYDKLQQKTKLPVLHIVDAAIENLRDASINSGTVGVMATSVTLQFELYQSRLHEHGYDCELLGPAELTDYCTAPIELIKMNQLDGAGQAIATGVSTLHERGARAVILGCTELPLALPHSQRSQWNIPVIDSIDALAQAAIRWYTTASS